MGRKVIDETSYEFNDVKEPFIVTTKLNEDTMVLSNPSASASQIDSAIHNGLTVEIYASSYSSSFPMTIMYVDAGMVRFCMLYEQSIYIYVMNGNTIELENSFLVDIETYEGTISWSVAINSLDTSYTVKQYGNMVNVNINLKINGELGNTSVVIGTVNDVDLPSESMRFPCITANNLLTSIKPAFIQLGTDGSLRVYCNDITDDIVIANISYTVDDAS